MDLWLELSFSIAMINSKLKFLFYSNPKPLMGHVEGAQEKEDTSKSLNVNMRT